MVETESCTASVFDCEEVVVDIAISNQSLGVGKLVEKTILDSRVAVPVAAASL